MSETPTKEGRDKSGRFIKGYKGGPGNPHANRVAMLRASIYKALLPKDIEEVMKTLVKKAKGGDVAAAKLVLGYAVSQPLEIGGDLNDPAGRIRVIASIPKERAFELMREHS